MCQQHQSPFLVTQPKKGTSIRHGIPCCSSAYQSVWRKTQLGKGGGVVIKNNYEQKVEQRWVKKKKKQETTDLRGKKLKNQFIYFVKYFLKKESWAAEISQNWDDI